MSTPWNYHNWRSQSKEAPPTQAGPGINDEKSILLPPLLPSRHTSGPSRIASSPRPSRRLPPLTSAALASAKFWHRRSSQIQRDSHSNSSLYESIVARKLYRYPSYDPQYRLRQQSASSPSQRLAQHRAKDAQLPAPSSSIKPSSSGAVSEYSGNHTSGVTAAASSPRESGNMTGQHSTATPGPSAYRVASGMAIADLLSGNRMTGGAGQGTSASGETSRPPSFDEADEKAAWHRERRARGQSDTKGESPSGFSQSFSTTREISKAPSHDRAEAGQPPPAPDMPTEGLAYQYAPVQQITEGRANIEYILHIREQPKHSRMCGIGEKADRRPVDPAPIVQLRVVTHAHPVSKTGNSLPQGRGGSVVAPDAITPLRRGQPVVTEEGEGWEDKAWYLENPCYFMCAMLADPEKDVELHLLADGKTRYTTGSCVSCLYHLKDIDGSHQGFFVFPDLSIRVEGRYRLKLCLFETIGTQVHHCKSIYSSVFMVYTAKRFPGMEESTQLSRAFAGQGLKVRVRKNARGKRMSRHSAGSGELDKYRDEDSDEERQRQVTMHRRRIDSSASESKRLRSNSYISVASSNEHIPRMDPRHKGPSYAYPGTGMSGSGSQHVTYSPPFIAEHPTRASGMRSNTISDGTAVPSSEAALRSRAWTTSVSSRPMIPQAHQNQVTGMKPENASRRGPKPYASQMRLDGVEGVHRTSAEASHSPSFPGPAYFQSNAHDRNMQIAGSHIRPPFMSSVAVGAPRSSPSPPQPPQQRSYGPGVETQAGHTVYQQPAPHPRYQHAVRPPPGHGRQRSVSSAAVPSNSWQQQVADGQDPALHVRLSSHGQPSIRSHPLTRPSIINHPAAPPPPGSHQAEERWGSGLVNDLIQRDGYPHPVPPPPPQSQPQIQHQYEHQSQGPILPHSLPHHYRVHQEQRRPSSSGSLHAYEQVSRSHGHNQHPYPHTPAYPHSHQQRPQEIYHDTTRERSSSDPRRTFPSPHSTISVADLTRSHHGPHARGPPPVVHGNVAGGGALPAIVDLDDGASTKFNPAPVRPGTSGSSSNVIHHRHPPPHHQQQQHQHQHHDHGVGGVGASSGLTIGNSSTTSAPTMATIIPAMSSGSSGSGGAGPGSEGVTILPPLRRLSGSGTGPASGSGSTSSTLGPP